MKILALGDSYFTGYLVGDFSFIKRLQKSYSIMNVAQNGADTFQLLSFAKKIREHYDLAMVHIGINDFLMGQSLEKVEQNILYLIHLLRPQVQGVILIVPPQISNDSFDCGWSNSITFQSTIRKQKEYNQFLKLLQNSFIYTVSLYDFFLTKEEGSLIDGIHPDKIMHEKIAQILKKEIKEVEIKLEMDRTIT